jgi:hypothetical protein
MFKLEVVIPLRKCSELFVKELTRFEKAPAWGSQSRTFDKSLASTKVIRNDSRTTLDAPSYIR